MLRLNNIQVIYSDVILVLKGLSLEVAAGQIVALLGANGAGKTTTLKAISGLLKTEDGRVTDGSIEFMGRRIDGLDPEDICRRGIVQVMEGRKVLETLTVEENLRIGGYTWRDADGIQQDLRMIYEYFPILVTRRHQVAGYLSGGEQQMLVIGRALMARPKLLLLDEPSLGLAPLLVREIFDIIRDRLLRKEDLRLVQGRGSPAGLGREDGNSSIVSRRPLNRYRASTGPQRRSHWRTVAGDRRVPILLIGEVVLR